MNPDWLRQLAPAHSPPALAWWPLAPGWWLLLALIAISCTAWFAYHNRPAQKTRRAALRELERIAIAAHDSKILAQRLENLLRRYSLVRFDRDAVAALTGEEWLEFVAAHGGRQLSGSAGLSLLRIAYGGEAREERQAWLDGARAFIKDKS